MPALNGILETALYTDDMARARAFYEDVLSLKPIFSDNRLCAYGVAERNVLVRAEGKHGKIVRARRRRALGQRGDEIGLAPPADPVLRVGRDVGRVEGAERRLEREPAAELRAVVLVRRDVAGRTSAGEQHGAPVGEIGIARRQGARRHGLRNGDDPERRDAERGDDDHGVHELAQHHAVPVPGHCERSEAISTTSV